MGDLRPCLWFRAVSCQSPVGGRRTGETASRAIPNGSRYAENLRVGGHLPFLAVLAGRADQRPAEGEAIVYCGQRADVDQVTGNARMVLRVAWRYEVTRPRTSWRPSSRLR